MIASDAQQPVVVELDKARYDTALGGGRVTLRLNLKACAGELICIRVDRRRMMGLVGDACSGMMLPTQGRCLFAGRSWQSQDPRTVSAMRAGIGRGGAAAPWLPFLSVADNVLLAQMHHTKRPAEELIEQAATLARGLGLPGLPTDMPAEVGSSDLHRAGIVRAFMGRPKLVLLEQADARDPQLVPLLVNRILVAQRHGAAVIWVSDTFPSFGRSGSIRAARYRLRANGKLEATP